MSLSNIKFKAFEYVFKNCRRFSDISFVPRYDPASEKEFDILRKFILYRKNILVVTGAGVSTESGIPDYRSEDVGLYARSNHKPIQHSEFLKSIHVRRKYWLRNFVAWPHFSQIKPNIVHESLVTLEKMGKVSCIITQNVDRLHSKAGSRNVIELHGTSHRVICLKCFNITPRHDFQDTLKKLNPYVKTESTVIRPDGDVEISDDQVGQFIVPPCNKCSGILKPDIVFFGDKVPRTRGQKVTAEVLKSDSLLVLGSSLSTFSGYRIILQAKEANKGVAIINIGPTRADKEADLKISTKCGDILSKLVSSI